MVILSDEVDDKDSTIGDTKFRFGANSDASRGPLLTNTGSNHNIHHARRQTDAQIID